MRARSPSPRACEEALEAQHAVERLGPVADGAVEAPQQLALAGAEGVAQLADRAARTARAGGRRRARAGRARRGAPAPPPRAARARASALGASPSRSASSAPQISESGTRTSRSSLAGRPSTCPAVPVRKRRPTIVWPGSTRAQERAAVGAGHEQLAAAPDEIHAAVGQHARRLGAPAGEPRAPRCRSRGPPSACSGRTRDRPCPEATQCPKCSRAARFCGLRSTFHRRRRRVWTSG